MPVDPSDIKRIARLSNLELDEEEIKTFGPQIASIVNYVEQLNELDTTNIEPAIGGLTAEDANTPTRPDEVAGSLGQKAALDQAPDTAYGYFRVPKVL
jgi:aspartyl-tRNA(Asn)/glutamyl-tRNA(Gln) amidotransferase subunit C